MLCRGTSAQQHFTTWLRASAGWGGGMPLARWVGYSLASVLAGLGMLWLLWRVWGRKG